MPKIYITNHIVDDIRFADDWMRCVCSWEGSIADHEQHKKDSPKLPPKTVTLWQKMYGYKADRHKQMDHQVVLMEVDFLPNLAK